MGRPSSRQSDGSVQATLTTSVFERLRADILEGVIPPGEKLRIDALRTRYQIGASPLREALNRLVALHLVAQIEQRGFRVTVTTPDQLEELARTRCWVSEIAVREAIAHGDAAWEEEIVLAHHRLRRCHERLTGPGPNKEWETLHRRFHAALIAACPSRWIREFHETLFDLSDRARHLSVRKSGAVRDVKAEHQAITEAVVARDTPKAVELLNAHFSRTAAMAIAVMGEPRAADAGVIDLGAPKLRPEAKIRAR